jgi:hypothetical protein
VRFICTFSEKPDHWCSGDAVIYLWSTGIMEWADVDTRRCTFLCEYHTALARKACWQSYWRFEPVEDFALRTIERCLKRSMLNDQRFPSERKAYIEARDRE